MSSPSGPARGPRLGGEARWGAPAFPLDGDMWTWTAIDTDTKLVPTWRVGGRTIMDAYVFLGDLKRRLKDSHIQLTTDGLSVYLRVVNGLWAEKIDFAAIHKIYCAGPADTPERRFNIHVISGDPDPAKISTSHVERPNLTMRMNMRRFTRLTNAFSRKLENHVAAISLHFMHYNFARPHQTLTKRYGRPTTPAMAAALATYPWSVTQIAQLLD